MTEAEEKRAYRFKGRVAMVTGAASGIGRATALGFAVEGADLAICDINEGGLRALSAEITALGRRCHLGRVDVSKKAEAFAFVEAAAAALGPIDILVNNAGTGQFQPFAMMEDDEYDRVMDINVRSIFNFSRAVLPSMMDRDYGRIVNITSIMSVIAGQGQSVYNTSKGAAKMMTQGMAVDLSGYNINVNAVGPGMVHTGLTRNLLGDAASAAEFEEKIPKRRIGVPDDIAAGVLFLCSDAASYVHGETLFIDGGMLCAR
ncbi:MAG: SDR family oxidoreductase [Spirochaetes bacterium]|nr:SDR family oxidoreductase [Spirochaetota bacterium]MBU1081931.1 SDR family oxidoreductase [Spirochaetota bacterium]